MNLTGKVNAWGAVLGLGIVGLIGSFPVEAGRASAWAILCLQTVSAVLTVTGGFGLLLLWAGPTERNAAHGSPNPPSEANTKEAK